MLCLRVLSTAKQRPQNTELGKLSIDESLFLTLAERYEEAPIEDRWRAILDDVKDEYLSPHQAFPWIVGFSGGKDSTVVAHAVFEALLDIPPR